VIVPEHAPATKLAAIERLGASIVKIPFDEWWQVVVKHHYPGIPGFFIHPFSNPAVLAGNGTIGLEILEDLPHVDTVLVPYGGGGLSTGIAAALRSSETSSRPRLVYACEVATAAPLAASLAAGAPRAVEYRASFVDGIGGMSVFEEMWPLARKLLAGSLVVAPNEAAVAIRLLMERTRLVTEGAGAVPVAAALSGAAGAGTIVCVVSGGNIDAQKLAAILSGELP
jgi:threonine dehydratase